MAHRVAFDGSTLKLAWQTEVTRQSEPSARTTTLQMRLWYRSGPVTTGPYRP